MVKLHHQCTNYLAICKSTLKISTFPTSVKRFCLSSYSISKNMKVCAVQGLLTRLDNKSFLRFWDRTVLTDLKTEDQITRNYCHTFRSFTWQWSLANCCSDVHPLILLWSKPCKSHSNFCQTTFSCAFADKSGYIIPASILSSFLWVFQHVTISTYRDVHKIWEQHRFTFSYFI